MVRSLQKPLAGRLFLVLSLIIGSWAAHSVEEEQQAVEADSQDWVDAAREAVKQRKNQAGEAKPHTISREGLSVEYDISSSGGATAPGQVTELDQAEIRFTIKDAQSGEPVSGLYPVVWMDIAEAFDALHGKHGQRMSCRDRVGIYLQGIVGVRPLIDLNSYFVMILNQDPTISVIDPIIGITGRTNLYAQIVLKRAGADWAKTGNERRMFVSMPVADMAAVVDLETFTVTHNINAGDNPQRVVLQSDEKYLWVGNDSNKEGKSGVTVIDAHSLKHVKFIPTGKGHHEIAIAGDDRYVFVTNRDQGSVSIIDVQTLEKVKDFSFGPKPIAIAYSPFSETVYIADGETGEIGVVGADNLAETSRIATKPGLGPMRFSKDGRWAVAVNPNANAAYVIDASNNTVAHTVTIEGRPFHVTFSDTFAYIRSLDNEWVHMINASQLGKQGKPLVTRFSAGKAAPAKARDLVIADTMVPAPGEASMLVASPADLTVYYYMEGMNAPMGNFRNYGHRPRAVGVVDRTLKEREPGVYSAKVKIPAAGNYDVVFLLDTPRLLHCFETVAEPNPSIERNYPPVAIKYLTKDRKVALGETARIRFQLTDPKNKKPRADLQDVTVLYYPASGRGRSMVRAEPEGDGVYEAALSITRPEAYYVWVSAPSLEVDYRDLELFSLIAVREKPKAPAP